MSCPTDTSPVSVCPAWRRAASAVVAEIELPGGTSAAPITYMADGKQYIVVAVGWSDMESEWVALALP